jgi:hypothetical protein
MIRHCALFLSLVSMVLFASLIISCGGSSHSGPTPCTGTFNVVGDWQGSVTSGGSSDALVGTIDSSGNAVFFDSSADIATVSPLTGACSFSSTLSLYASIESGTPGTETGTATGNVTSDTAFNGTESVNGTSGTFSFSSYSPLGTGSVTAVSGTVGAEVEGQTTDGLILTLGGSSSSITFSGTDASNCTFNGTFTQEGTNNVYDVAFNVAGAGCTASNFTGVGFEGDSSLLADVTGGSGTYLYAVFPSSSAPFVVEVLPSGADTLKHVHNPRMSTSFSKVFGFNGHLSR